MQTTKDPYGEFLRLTGFEEKEMSQYVPELHRLCDILKLTEADVRHAVTVQLPTYFEVELEGVRKLIGCYIREIIDLTHANEYKEKGVKIVYGILPAISPFYYALKGVSPDGVYIGFPDAFLTHILNRFFSRKSSPFLEEAEKHGMSYGCRHCALNKMRYAARRMGIIPSPDISWIWGFVCDEGPKSDEFINLMYDPEWKTYVTRFTHDQPLYTIEDEDVKRITYVAKQMRDGFEYVQNVVGIKVSGEAMKKSVEMYHRYMAALGELQGLLGEDPQPLRTSAWQLASLLNAMPLNTGMERAQEAVAILTREIKERVAKGQGILPKGAPRLLFYVVPACVPFIQDMFQDAGIACVSSLKSKKEAKRAAFDDPYMATSQAWLRAAGVTNLGYEAMQIIEKLEGYHADGMVFGFLDYDRWLGSSQRMLSRIVENETKLPVYYIEGDYWDDRDYGPEALRTRIESIASIVKMRKAGVAA